MRINVSLNFTCIEYTWSDSISYCTLFISKHCGSLASFIQHIWKHPQEGSPDEIAKIMEDGDTGITQQVLKDCFWATAFLNVVSIPCIPSFLQTLTVILHDITWYYSILWNAIDLLLAFWYFQNLSWWSWLATTGLSSLKQVQLVQLWRHVPGDRHRSWQRGWRATRHWQSM